MEQMTSEQEYQAKRAAIDAELRGKIDRMNQRDNYFLVFAFILFMVVGLLTVKLSTVMIWVIWILLLLGAIGKWVYRKIRRHHGIK